MRAVSVDAAGAFVRGSHSDRGLRLVVLLVSLLLCAWLAAPPNAYGIHAGGEVACSLCHQPHQATLSPSLLDVGDDSITTQVGICMFCHEVGATGAPFAPVEDINIGAPGTEVFPSGHRVESASATPDLTNDCSGCHNPHTETAKLPQMTINGWVIDTAVDPNDWCRSCHDPDSDDTDDPGLTPDANWSGVTGDAYYDQIFTSREVDTYIGFGTFRGWPAYVNTSAHASIPADPAEGRAAGDCLWCHERHSSTSTYDNLIAEFGPTSKAACDECHDDHLVLDPAGDWGTGHLISGSSVLPDGTPLPCYECHNAHGSRNGNAVLGQDSLGANLDPSTPAGQSAFCYTCHLSSDGYGWNSYSSPAGMEIWATLAAKSGITTAVAGIPRGDMIVLPDTIAQHASDTLEGCSCHGSVHAPGPGVSAGGQPCYDCHMALEDDMEWDSASVAPYGHAVGTSITDGDTASYPNYTTDSKSNVYCLSCHMDHTFNTDKGLNLRTSVDGAVTAARTDHAVGTASGLCVSCHSVAVGSVTYTVAGLDYQSKAHDYVVNDAATVGYDGTSAFNPNCTKCHTDPAGLDGRQDGTYKIAPHFSDDESRLAKALGATLALDLASQPVASTEENLCFACHDGDATVSADPDGYGVGDMSDASQDVYDQFKTAGYYTHGVDDPSWAGVHTSDETAFTSSNKHIECEDCHNPHAAGDTLNVSGGTDGNQINTDSPLLGVWGVSPTYLAAAKANQWTEPTGSTAVAGGSTQYEYQICFKCHSGYNTAYDPNTRDTGNNPAFAWGGVGADAWTNVALEFNPSNSSYHPVYQALPQNWLIGTTTVNYRRITSINTARLQTGWTTPGQTMTCSDCHGSLSASTTAQGPHGSSVEHILKGTWPIRTDGNPWSLSNTSYTGLLCNNCHNIAQTKNAKPHSQHTSADRGTCFWCHIVVPHGGEMGRLLGDNGETTGGYTGGTMPSRYAYNNDKSNLAIVAFNPTLRDASGVVAVKNACQVNDTQTGLATQQNGPWGTDACTSHSLGGGGATDADFNW
ncbi:MAG: hypothetical protein JXP37_03305 [Coriobacteriia bacterium]|nr:hypothetical protein [Coriobacteriia bacterium]